MAAFEWPLGKLELINSALSQSGDNLCNVADDGSDEWNCASPAYERALAFMIEDHTWSQATMVRELQPSPTPPSDQMYDTAYDLPPDLVHLIWARLADRPCVWDILNDQLVVNSQGGPPPPSPPTTPAKVTIKAVFSTNSDPSFSTPTFIVALQLFVEAGIYRGMHKDIATADKQEEKAMAILARAKFRHDEQKPKVAAFNSTMTAARRSRKPWRHMPRPWGNTGTPS